MKTKENPLVYLVLPVLLLTAGLLAAFRPLPDLFEIGKNKEILAELYQAVNEEYVDEITPSRLMRTGVDAMLASLDPYTVYFSESEISDARMENASAFGGIGASLRQQGDQVAIETIYENGAAQAAGLQAGDIIIAINGRKARGRTVAEVSTFLEGQAGAAIILTLLRNKEQVQRTLSRSEVSKSNLVWHGMVDKNTGYIKLAQFGPGATDEFRDAFMELRESGLENLVIDLRDNPGGILQEAVSLCNLFIDKGQLIVSTKGKNAESNRSFSTTGEALDTSIPVSVLINNHSASASEIVAGAFQDLDRAVIVGQRSFGKGLVQATKPLPYNSQLKVTIAKYYIPSGRCIQALDYTHRNPDGSVGKIPDSLVSDYKTQNGRSVQDGGGVLPDVVIDRPVTGTIVASLLEKGLIFDATRYQQEHDSIPPPAGFRLADADYQDFLDFLSGKDYSYTTESELLLEKYKETAQNEHYFEAIKNDYQALGEQLRLAKKNDLENHRETIINMLTQEIAARYYYQSGRTQAALAADPELQQALVVMDDKNKYDEVLRLK